MVMNDFSLTKYERNNKCSIEESVERVLDLIELLRAIVYLCENCSECGNVPCIRPVVDQIKDTGIIKEWGEYDNGR